MRLTTSHSSSSYGIPIFVDADNTPMDYAPALRQLRKEKGWSVADLASECGVSPRTVEGWEQGRMPNDTKTTRRAFYLINANWLNVAYSVCTQNVDILHCRDIHLGYLLFL